jgi:hypothetical protein
VTEKLSIGSPTPGPSESALKEALRQTDRTLGGRPAAPNLKFTPPSSGKVNMADLAKAAAKTPESIPDKGFPPNPVVGATKP